MSFLREVEKTVEHLRTAETIEGLSLPSNSFLIYSNVEPDHRASVSYWEKVSQERKLNSFAVINIMLDQGTFEVLHDGKTFTVISSDLASLLQIIPSRSHVVIDISGVDHEFWAACMVGLKDHVLALSYIYTEPSEYKFRVTPNADDAFETSLFDLSDRTGGVSPLPYFVNLIGPASFDDKAVFVPLLGFEERRALNILNELDPRPPEVIPIVGMPGYRLEFPTYTISCNEGFFRETRSDGYIRYAPANDPFAVRDVLQQISEDVPDKYMYIAPIGTRPHAVGALMFADKNRDRAEILFDHPVRTGDSRRGAGKSHMYRIF